MLSASVALLAVLVRLPLPPPGERVAVYVSCARVLAADAEVAENLVVLRRSLREKGRYVRVVEHPDAAAVLIEIDEYQVRPVSGEREHHEFAGRVRVNREWEHFRAVAEPFASELYASLAHAVEQLIFVPAELSKARQSE